MSRPSVSRMAYAAVPAILCARSYFGPLLIGSLSYSTTQRRLPSALLCLRTPLPHRPKSQIACRVQLPFTIVVGKACRKSHRPLSSADPPADPSIY